MLFNLWWPLTHKKCKTGKECYDKKSAITKINFKRKRGVRLRAYYCEFCNGWHVTSHDRDRHKYK